MKKLLLFSAIALLLSATIGCEKEEKEKEIYGICGNGLNILPDTIENIDAIVMYNSSLSSFAINLESTYFLPLVPVENSLPKEFHLEKLKVIVSGKCREVKDKNNHYYSTIKISSIKKR